MNSFISKFRFSTTKSTPPEATPEEPKRASRNSLFGKVFSFGGKSPRGSRRAAAISNKSLVVQQRSSSSEPRASLAGRASKKSSANTILHDNPLYVPPDAEESLEDSQPEDESSPTEAAPSEPSLVQADKQGIDGYGELMPQDALAPPDFGDLELSEPQSAPLPANEAIQPAGQSTFSSVLSTTPQLRAEAEVLLHVLDVVQLAGDIEVGSTVTLDVEGKHVEVKLVQNSEGRKQWEIKEEGKTTLVNENAQEYKGVEKQDFYDRANLIFDSAEAYCKRVGADTSDLQGLKEMAFDRMAQIEVNRNPDEQIPEMKAFLQSVVDLLKGMMPEDDEGKPFNIVEAEKQFIVERGRPTIINVYEYKGDGGNNVKFFGMQRPMSDKTLPSTVQDQKGLVNYVSSTGGVIRPDGSLDIRFQATRHSRPTPIAIKNNAKRHAIAAENVQQAIVDQAKEQIPKGETGSQDKPIRVRMSPVTLLTAKRGDAARNKKKIVAGKWTGESEAMQLKETALAYQLYDGRPMQVNIDGQDVWIQPEIIHMNYGINLAGADAGTFGRIPDDPITNQLNHLGMARLTQAVEEHIKGRSLSTYTFPADVQKQIDTIRSERAHLQGEMNQIKEELHELYQGEPLNEKAIAAKEQELTKMQQEIFKNGEKEFKILKAHREKILEFIDKQISLLVAGQKTQEGKQMREVLIAYKRAMVAVYGNANKSVGTVMEPAAALVELNMVLGRGTCFYCKSAEDRTGNLEVRCFCNMMYREISGETIEGPINTQKYHIVNELMPQAMSVSASLENTKWNSEAKGLQVGGNVNPPSMKKILKQGKTMAGFAKGIQKKK